MFRIRNKLVIDLQGFKLQETDQVLRYAVVSYVEETALKNPAGFL